MPEPVRVFRAYSRKDQQFRNTLTAHLSGLSRSGLIVFWFDRFIDPGVDWNREIAAQLEKAEIVLLLLSADFVASEYCMGVEYQRALERASSGSLRTVPILLRDFYPRPPEIMKYQGLSSDGNPVTHWKDPDSAYADISRGIETVAKEIRQLTAKPQTNDASGDSRVVRFADTDVLGWVRVAFLALLRRKYTWRESTYTPTVLPDQCRAAIFGAWGTGLYGAPVLAKTIQADGCYQLLLHLGDVYYSGTEEEIRERFLAPWPHVPGAISRALCGNPRNV